MINFATITNLTTPQWIVVVVLLAIFLGWWKKQPAAEGFMAQQQTLTGSKFVDSIHVSGLQPAALSLIQQTIPVPYFDAAVKDEWAQISVSAGGIGGGNGSGSGSGDGAIASGQPMPVAVVPSVPVYRINAPPISAPILSPITGAASETGPVPSTVIPITNRASLGVITNANIVSPTSTGVPPHHHGFNKTLGVDWPGNDIKCSMYSRGHTAETCHRFCQSNPNCVGFVDVKTGTNSVFPKGFCCSKHTMADPMASIGVDTYHKMTLSASSS